MMVRNKKRDRSAEAKKVETVAEAKPEVEVEVAEAKAAVEAARKALKEAKAKVKEKKTKAKPIIYYAGQVWAEFDTPEAEPNGDMYDRLRELSGKPSLADKRCRSVLTLACKAIDGWQYEIGRKSR